MDTTTIGRVAEILLAASDDLTAEPGAEEHLYLETCRTYGFDPRRMPARLRAPFVRVFGAYVKQGDLGALSHGQLLCLYLGVMAAAREYEGR